MVIPKAPSGAGTASEIERIDGPGWEVFWHDYVHQQKPVIITNLFDGQPLRNIDTRDKARKTLGNMTLTFKGEYVQHFLKRVRGEPVEPQIGREMTFNQYCDYVDSHPQSLGWMGQEYAPRSLKELFRVPAYCTNPDGSRDRRLIVHTFIGHCGKSASLHTDTDYKQVLVYEVYGRKQIFLLPPNVCHALKPVSFLATLDLSRFSYGEKVALVEELGGWHTVLEPGEAIFLPFSLYHHFEYLEDAMSVNIRFGRNRYHRVFYKYSIPHWSLHNTAAVMATESSIETQYGELYRNCLRVLEEPAPSAYAKFTAVTRFFEEVARELVSFPTLPGNLKRILENRYYEVPHIAKEFVYRYRLHFQKCYWHRKQLDLSAHLPPSEKVSLPLRAGL